jgi:hypothetical protein
LLTLLASPAIIFLAIIISLPIVSYKKKKKISAAINKSKEIKSVIKVAIT